MTQQQSSDQPGSAGALDRLGSRFSLAVEPVSVGGINLSLPDIRDPVSYINARLEQADGGPDDLPYWTKVWPASLVLAQMAARLPVNGDGPLLELGAGMGLPGLVAAASGRQVVLSDLDPDALEFARAAVELNHLEDRVKVVALNWSEANGHLGPFHTVLGAELFYHASLHRPLLDLLERLLSQEGTAYLTHQAQPNAGAFFRRARERFIVRGTERSLKADGQRIPVFLYALKKIA